MSCEAGVKSANKSLEWTGLHQLPAYDHYFLPGQRWMERRLIVWAISCMHLE